MSCYCWRDTLTIALQAESDIEMALRRAPITRKPALAGFGAPRKPAGVASIGNGLYVRTGRRV